MLLEGMEVSFNLTKNSIKLQKLKVYTFINNVTSVPT